MQGLILLHDEFRDAPFCLWRIFCSKARLREAFGRADHLYHNGISGIGWLSNAPRIDWSKLIVAPVISPDSSEAR